MTDEVKLKACPFCGSEHVYEDAFVCRCMSCDISGPSTGGNPVNEWNTRPAEQELLDALRDGLRVTEPFGPNSTRGGPEELDWRANAVALISKHGGGQ